MWTLLFLPVFLSFRIFIPVFPPPPPPRTLAVIFVSDFLLSVLLLLFLLLFCPLREIRVALLGKGTAAARAALPIAIGVYCSFLCPNNGMAAST